MLVHEVNTSPFAGARGTYVTLRNLRDRAAKKKLLTNVSLKNRRTPRKLITFVVMAEASFQLLDPDSRMMRREGYELMVGKPEIGHQAQRRQAHGADREAHRRRARKNFRRSKWSNWASARAKVVNMHNHGYGRRALEFACPAADSSACEPVAH